MTPESNTPRTDETNDRIACCQYSDEYGELLKFARTLELELAEITVQLSELRGSHFRLEMRWNEAEQKLIEANRKLEVAKEALENISTKHPSEGHDMRIVAAEALTLINSTMKGQDK